MEQPIEVRYTFIMLLAIADPTGRVVGTDVAIARRLNMPLDSFVNSVKQLGEPDPDSNSKEEEGRRVIPSDSERGYQLVNYIKYRNLKDEEEKREYMREYMRKRREDEALRKTCKTVLTDVKNVTQAEAEAEAEEDKNTSTPQTPPAKPKRTLDESPEFLKFWEAYPRKVGKPNAARAFAKALRTATAEDIMGGLVVHLPAWAESDPQFTPHPATWLNRNGWTDFPPPLTRQKPSGNYSQPGYRQQPTKPVITETDRFVRQQIEDGILRVTADGKIEAVPIEELSKTKP